MQMISDGRQLLFDFAKLQPFCHLLVSFCFVQRVETKELIFTPTSK